MADIPNLNYTSRGADREIMVDSSKHGRVLLGYIFLFDELTTRAKEYSIVFERKKEEYSTVFERKKEELKRMGLLRDEEFIWMALFRDEEFKNGISNGYGRASYNKFAWSWRSNSGEREARQAVKELFERALSEFEFRSTF